MKKKILISLGLASQLLAEVTTVIPYVADIQFTKDSLQSPKDSGKILGTYLSYGDLSYLLEFDYAKTNIGYKDSTVSDLTQDDLTLAYSAYGPKFMWKAGIHKINTTDTGLGDGIVYLGTIGNYFWDNYDKYSLGIEGYYSDYKNGSGNIVTQFTPYGSFSKSISIEARNDLTLKLNYIDNETTYISYEADNTFYYRNSSTTIKYYTGEMKTGIKDGGNTVFNSKDILLNGYGLKFGYTLFKDATVSASYGKNYFKVSSTSPKASNAVTVASFQYSF